MNNTNSIREIVLQNQEAIAIKAISEKIFTLMKNIRNGSSDESYQRRWVWELLQNAMDTSNSERLTKIKIFNDELTNNLHFLHNGNPFKVDNITFLVNQQSSKPRHISINERKRSIGKFGTGFITTHLLSEKVTLKSTVDADKLGHKNFEIILDRSGNDEAELFEGVKKSMEILLNLDQLPDVVNYDQNDLNTEFIYHLSESGKLVAKNGINDLISTLPYTMAFVRNIDVVEITSQNIFKYEGYEILDSNIFIHNIRVNNQELRKILTVESITEDAIIGIEINVNSNKIELLEIDKHTPRLFCNYPFIGTEGMNIPVVFNSSSFNVYQETRNGIILKDANTNDINENKKIILECKSLFFRLLDYVSQNSFNFINTYLLADYKKPQNYEWLNDKWYDENILKPIQNKIIESTIVEIEPRKEDESGIEITMMPIKGVNSYVDFPFHKNEAVRERIFDLCNTPNYFILPLKKNIHKWYNINWWVDSYDLSIKNLSNWFASKNNLENINLSVRVEDNFSEWINNFINLFNEEDSIINLINQNKLAIYPNQNGDLVSKNIIYLENGEIPEELKNILFTLGVDIRKILLDKDLTINGAISIDKEKVIDVRYVINQIKDQVNNYNSKKMNGISLSHDIQSTFRNLYIWMCNNHSFSDYFGELYEKKETRLLDENTIKQSIERDQKTKGLMEKYGIVNIEEIEELLITKNNYKKEIIDPDNLLISIGLTSIDDLERAKVMFINNKEISEALNYISINDIERLEIVLKLIKRAKENVFNKLITLPEYDCSNWSETSLTTIAGIKKNGIPIELVIRPGDGNQIILFYTKEFDALENNLNELWYDKESEQGLYTFGRFLKKSKINRLPI